MGGGGGGRSSESGGGGGKSNSGGGEGKSELGCPDFPCRDSGRLARLILPGLADALKLAEESLDGEPVVEEGVEKEVEEGWLG